MRSLQGKQSRLSLEVDGRHLEPEEKKKSDRRFIKLLLTRSLRALRALTPSWRPFDMTYDWIVHLPVDSVFAYE